MKSNVSRSSINLYVMIQKENSRYMSILFKYPNTFNFNFETNLILHIELKINI